MMKFTDKDLIGCVNFDELIKIADVFFNIQEKDLRCSEYHKTVGRNEAIGFHPISKKVYVFTNGGFESAIKDGYTIHPSSKL